MTRPDNRLAARRHASSPEAHRAGAGLSSLVARDDHWLSSAAVREAVGAWAYARAGGQGRPAPTAVRAAVGVAAAIVEQEHARPLGLPSEGPRAESSVSNSRSAEIPEDLAGLADRAGYGDAEVRAALELLAAARVVSRRVGATMPTVAVDPGVLVPAPTAARVHWPQVRARLRAGGASLPPALAVLRELALMVGAPGDSADRPSVRASVRELEDRTAFGRSTVSDALAALERAGVLAVEIRAGRTTRFVLHAAAPGWPPVGDPDSEPGPPAPSTRGLVGDTPHHPRERPRSAAGEGATPAVAPLPPSVRPVGDVAPRAPVTARAPVLIGEFAGTPIHAPPGTPLVLEQDASGGWTCRVGPLLRLGPVHTPE